MFRIFCSLAPCDYSSTRSSNLVRHLRQTHEACDDAIARFQKNLAASRAGHRGNGGPWQCEGCGHVCPSRKGLASHIERKHRSKNVNDPAASSLFVSPEKNRPAPKMKRTSGEPVVLERTAETARKRTTKCKKTREDPACRFIAIHCEQTELSGEMKRAANFDQFQPEHVFREPKEEIEDDPDLYNFANGTNGQTEFDFFVKEEEPDDYEQHNFPTDHVIKEEVQDDYFFANQMSHNSQSPATKKWRPSGMDLRDFMTQDDDDDDAFGLNLGSSILFQNPSGEEKKPNVFEGQVFDYEEAEEYFPYDDDEEPETSTRESLLPSQIRKYLDQAYAVNKHPDATEMIKISQLCGIRYRSVFERFEQKRNQSRIRCKKDDPCQRIKSFFEREYEALQNSRVPAYKKVILERELEAHLVSRKRFSVGYVHSIMEKTDLPPAYIRGQYEAWKRRLMTNDRKDYGIEDWKKETVEERNKLPRDVVKQMEEAYLKKKYESQYKDWSPKEIKSLAADLHLDEKTVAEWLEKRSATVIGLCNAPVVPSVNKDQPKVGAHTKRLPPRARKVLNAEFNVNSQPSAETRLRLAEQLCLTDVQIRNYFNKRRILVRRNKEWEEAVRAVAEMPRETVEVLERYAAEKRKSSTEYMKAAEKLGIPQITLTSYVNWKKYTRMTNR